MKSIFKALCALAVAVAAFSNANAADTEMTKLYKSLPAHEQQMVRAIVSVEQLYIAAVDFKTLSPQILDGVAGTDFGFITDLRKSDLIGLGARASAESNHVAVFTLGDSQCAQLLESMGSHLAKLGVIASASQASCDSAGFVVRSDSKN